MDRRYGVPIALVVAGAIACGSLEGAPDAPSSGDAGTPDAPTFDDAGNVVDDGLGTGDGRDGELVVDSTRELDPGSFAIAATAAAGTRNVLTEAPASSLGAGDIVLAWQTTVPGATTFPANAGRFQLARVASVDGARVTLDRDLASAFEPGAQLVRVPQYTTISVAQGAALQGRRWDGKTGGVLALFARGEAKIDGALDMTGRGFRGGPGEQTSTASSLFGCTNDGDHAAGFGWKGEGLAGGYKTTAGQFAHLNGGGGGVCHNSGGGGGGNGGSGGKGGKSWEYETPDANKNRDVGGAGGTIPGYDVSSAWVLGGGGGQADANDDLAVPPRFGAGGNGGGVICVRAPSITGAGEVRANGDGGSDDDISGGGGGGAGGVVWLDAPSMDPCPAVRATGGAGGAVTQQISGTGGGGGGGSVVVPAAAACAVDVTGGMPGNVMQIGDSHGALGGQVGRIRRR